MVEVGQELSIDEARLRAVVQEYESIASEARQIYNELRDHFARVGKFWGDDEPGHTFAKTFEPDSRTLLDNMNRTLGALTEEGKLLSGIAGRFEEADLDGRTSILGPGGERETPMGTGQSMAGGPVSPAPGVVDTPNSSAPVARAPISSPAQRAEGTAAEPVSSADSAGPGAQNQPAAASSDAGPNSPSAVSAGDGGLSGAPAPTAGNASSASGALPPSDPKGPSSRAVPETGPSKKVDGPGSAESQRTNTPWSGRSDSGGPRPDPARKVSAPPTRGGRPSTPGAPKAPAKGAPGTPKRVRREDKRVEARHATSNEGQELAEALMRRHGLQVTGFDTPGIALDTLRDIAQALDDVLTAHPYLDLPEFAIAECGDAVTRLDWVRSSGDGENIPRVKRLILNMANAKDADSLARKVSAEAERGGISRGSARRPLYSTVVRELGHALDVTGGLRAHPESQRTLISEYLSECGDSRFETPLGVVVTDYRRWRGRLSGYGFPHGRFEPGRALADAFAEVQLDAGKAVAPARVLHRLLVTTAKRHSTKTFPPDRV
ncbi:hypothetical protein B7C42_07094 [Nocardia cerradoensis]|uniref:WXG100 family type VII secretion target n=1 Tax=Nocardia cerradoensis TaxID=85688 RepID=A0A231GW07_9NOCA|nr:hypothetical protein B7C42_07094 [Nocardia cerradoensis]